MTGKTIKRIRDFVLLALAQVIIFSQIHLFGYATACIFTIFILKLPRHTTQNEAILWGFLFGIVTDLFCNTPGMHAAAATAMAFARKYILATFTHKGLPDDFIPGVKSLKWGGYLVYAIICITIFYAVLFPLELFAARQFTALLISTAASTAFTMLFVVVTEFFSPNR
jgi:rod shape-determining protein MreD